MSFYSGPLLDSEPENEPNVLIEDHCPICTEHKPLALLRTCGDYFCYSCIESYLQIKVSEADVVNISCPSCGQRLIQEDLSNYMSPITAAKYSHFVEVKRIEEDMFVKWCPQPNCQGYDVASPDNYNLKCNSCGHKYCYKCSQPWHKSKCKVKKDVSFELWALGNNVKLCPRCKNHVQKNGGCPHMSCPKCAHRWCWICGGDYSSTSHNAFTCMMGKTPLDLYWGIIFLMLLFPILVPFWFFLFVVYFYETEAIETDRMQGIFVCFRSRIFTYGMALVFSPLIEACGVVIAYFAVSYVIGMKNSYDSTKMEIAFRLIVGNMICNVAFVFAALVIVILSALMPVAGVFFAVFKIYFMITRCCKPKPEFEYPRLFF